ncbi:hypothetical protein [Psychroserpens mesophilus]|uniref:hypothetical protein n=1 Tax=Psychroserpens mesophilus TaxID=325473 RepID=UPI003D65E67F
MKAKLITLAGFFTLCFFSLTSMATLNDTETFEGIYDGQEEYGYNFIGIDEDDEEYTMTFQNIDKSLLKSFDLQSEKLIGTKFMVTYKITTEIESDEDGFEDEIETYTITGLKKL